MADRPTVYLLTYSDTAVSDPVARAFEERGWNCRQFGFSMPEIPRTLIGLRKLADPMVERKLLAAEYNRAIRHELTPALEENPPDLLLVMKGHRIDPANYAAIRDSGVPVFLWFYDSQERFPNQGDLVPLAEKVYVIDRQDVRDERYEWMPLGYDDALYRPSDAPPLLDILFIGKLEPQYYPTRRHYLLELANSHLPERFKVGSIGTTGSRLRDRLLRIHAPFQWLAPRMPPDLYAERIARARIVVNIHQDDGGMPVNPMFFGVAGSRVCQVVEQRDYLAEWLPGQDAYVPVGVDDYLPTLEALLEDEQRRDEVARAGYEAAREHTFGRRIDRILEDFSRIRR